jgi:hypothetical protein
MMSCEVHREDLGLTPSRQEMRKADHDMTGCVSLAVGNLPLCTSLPFISSSKDEVMQLAHLRQITNGVVDEVLVIQRPFENSSKAFPSM